MNTFHFLRPYWLIALIPLAWVCWRRFKSIQSGGSWSRLCDEALLPHLLISPAQFRSARPVWMLYALGGLLAVTALAGPVWERIPSPVFRSEAALIIALDLSRSMDAKDIKPSRLDRARFKIEDLLNQRKDGLTALLVYSGDAFTVTPLTDDVETIKSQLKSLTTDLMPAQGSRADLAFELAKRLLEQASLTHGDVLLISSGVNLTHGTPASQKLSENGFRVSVLGAGTEDGAPVPLPEGGFLQDTHGNIVVSKMAQPALKLLASEAGGIYRSMSVDHSDVSALSSFFDQSSKKAASSGAADNLQIDQWREYGPYLLILLLPIAALSFRRGYLTVWLILLMPLGKPVHAFEFESLWQTPDQRAAKAFEKGDVQDAANLFNRPDWKGAAQFRSGFYQEAAKTLEAIDSAESNYNRGNALAKLNQYPEALKAYERALQLDSKHEDARYNKEIIEKAMKDQAKQQDKEQQKDQKDQKDQNQDSKKGDKGDQSEPTSDHEDKKDADEPPKSDENASRQPSEKDQKDQKDQQAAKQSDESNQADEQWLKRIPDDPGGLLRRKFLYQYNQRRGTRP